MILVSLQTTFAFSMLLNEIAQCDSYLSNIMMSVTVMALCYSLSANYSYFRTNSSKQLTRSLVNLSFANNFNFRLLVLECPSSWFGKLLLHQILESFSCSLYIQLISSMDTFFWKRLLTRKQTTKTRTLKERTKHSSKVQVIMSN